MPTLSRLLPFSEDVFFRLFEQYNASIWPAQVVAYALGVALLVLALRPRRGGDRVIAVGLAVFWLWTGIAYHMLFFATINWAAWGFGALFALQGVAFVWRGALRGELRFRFTATPHGWVGLALAVFAMAGYPLAGWLAGHAWPRTAVFGVAPCPTTIFTLGLLLLAEPRVPLRLLAIPVLWAVIGGTAALLLAVPEDAALPLAAVLALALAIAKNRRARSLVR